MSFTINLLVKNILPFTNRTIGAMRFIPFFYNSSTGSIFIQQWSSYRNNYIVFHIPIICIYVFICIYSCINVCMHVYIYVFVCVCMYIYMYVYMYVCMCMYVCIYVYVYVYIYKIGMEHTPTELASKWFFSVSRIEQLEQCVSYPFV